MKTSENEEVEDLCRGGWAFAALMIVARAACLADGFRLVGPELQLSPNNAWWSNASYNPATDQYLVLWMSVGAQGWLLQARCINATTGQFATAEFNVGATVGLGAPVYNPQQQCWFVVYHTDHDIGGDIKGQKIGGSGIIGGPITLAQDPSDQQVPAVDYDPVRQRYLVVWADYQIKGPTIRGRFFDQNGLTIPGMSELQVSDPTIKSQNNPTVAYNPASSEFLVAWADARNDIFRTNPNENDNNYIDIYGQRVNAVSGQLVGGNIPIHSPFVQGQTYVGDGQDVPGILAYNTNPASPAFGVSLLPDQKLTTGFGFTTQGLMIDQQGNHYNGMGVFNISHPDRGGYTGGVYNPVDDVFISTYLDAGLDVSGKVFSTSGQSITSGKVIAHPDYEENFGSLAIRPSDGQCLQVTTLFEQLVGGARPYTAIAQRFIRDHTAPAAISGFTAHPGSRRLTLTWTNPLDVDFTGVVIRYSTTNYPTTIFSGSLLVDKTGAQGSSDSYTHTNLNAGTSYYYSAFAHDDLFNYASVAHAVAMPAALGDLDIDGDVDMSDFGQFQRCLSGSAVQYLSGCEDADFDFDGDIDAADFALFSGCLIGADQPPGC